MRDVDNFPTIDTILRDDSLGRKHTKIKIGVVGCSTGEQVYSYAMLCDKYSFSEYQVDGCDISEDRLIVARGGNYLLDDKIKKHLRTGTIRSDHVVIEQQGRLKVADHIKSHTNFSYGDIQRGPLPTRYHVIVCTFVLYQIYGEEAQRKAFINLIESIDEGGILVSEPLPPRLLKGVDLRRLNQVVQSGLGNILPPYLNTS